MNQITRQDLAAGHYSLVRTIVRRLSRRLPTHLRNDELEGDGSVGLVEAAQRFQPERGVNFRTFAARRIKGAILDALRSRSQRGRGVERRHKALTWLEEQLTAELGPRPLASDFEAAGLPVDELARRRTETARTQGVSLVELEQHRELSLASQEPAPALCVLRGQRLKALAGGIARQSERERERQVLALYDFEHWTIKRIGARLGAEARVSQIHAASLKKLRTCPELCELGPVT